MRKKNHSTKKRKEVAYEIMAHDLNLELADELLIHEEYIPEYFNLITADEQRNKVDEIEKVMKEED